jgi:hypothetical protein
LQKDYDYDFLKIRMFFIGIALDELLIRGSLQVEYSTLFLILLYMPKDQRKY